VGQAIGSLVELAIGQLLVLEPDRRRVRVRVHRPFEQLREGHRLRRGSPAQRRLRVFPGGEHVGLADGGSGLLGEEPQYLQEPAQQDLGGGIAEEVRRIVQGDVDPLRPPPGIVALTHVEGEVDLGADRGQREVLGAHPGQPQPGCRPRLFDEVVHHHLEQRVHTWCAGRRDRVDHGVEGHCRMLQSPHHSLPGGRHQL
jgi:hypothetical protein